MFTCVIRYEVDLNRVAEFRAYAESWIKLIERYGGTHHGYFLPCDSDNRVPSPEFSFPGLGSAAAANVGYAVFSFQDVASYDRYREEVAKDPDCALTTERFHASPCFESYERSFLTPVFAKEEGS